MVHVDKCPRGNRGTPFKDFTIDGKPQIYCLGWQDRMTDEPVAECKICKDYLYGEQHDIDCEKHFGNKFYI